MVPVSGRTLMTPEEPLCLHGALVACNDRATAVFDTVQGSVRAAPARRARLTSAWLPGQGWSLRVAQIAPSYGRKRLVEELLEALSCFWLRCPLTCRAETLKSQTLFAAHKIRAFAFLEGPEAVARHGHHRVEGGLTISSHPKPSQAFELSPRAETRHWGESPDLESAESAHAVPQRGDALATTDKPSQRLERQQHFELV